MTDQSEHLKEFVVELQKFPGPVLDNFNRAISEMSNALSEEQILDWLRRGIDIAGQTVRSWEAAAHFFQVSPSVISSMPYSYFVVGWSVELPFAGSLLLLQLHILKLVLRR